MGDRMLIELSKEDVEFLKKFLQEMLDVDKLAYEPEFRDEIPKIERILKKLRI
jgi:predicted transcriptional regulator